MLQINFTFGCHDNDDTPAETPLEVYNKNKKLEKLRNPVILQSLIKDAIGIDLNSIEDVRLSPVSKLYHKDQNGNIKDYFNNSIYINIGKPNEKDIQITIEGDYDGWWLSKCDNLDMISSYTEGKLPVVSEKEIEKIREEPQNTYLF